MTSRKSSGSIPLESAVDPTRSQNITVSWRRSAWAGAGAGGGTDAGVAVRAGAGAAALSAAMADRGHADGDQVVGRQVRQNVSVDLIVAERRLVLSKTELLQPTRDIDRHRRSNSQGRLNIRRLHHDRNR